jgi:hypothetical protein
MKWPDPQLGMRTTVGRDAINDGLDWTHWDSEFGSTMAISTLDGMKLVYACRYLKRD